MNNKVKHIRPTIDDMINAILADEMMMQFYKIAYWKSDKSSAKALEAGRCYNNRAYSANNLRRLIGEPQVIYHDIFTEPMNEIYANNPSSISIPEVMITSNLSNS